jgi:riboflavin synthase alpha subunit
MFGGLIRDMADILKTGKKFALAEDSYFSVVRDHAHQNIFIVTNGTCQTTTTNSPIHGHFQAFMAGNARQSVTLA